MSELKKLEIDQIKHLEPNEFNLCEISFFEVISEENNQTSHLPSDSYHLMLGKSHGLWTEDIGFDEEKEEFLLQLDSSFVTNAKWNDWGDCYFIISKEDLKNFNFDNVRVATA